MAEDHIVLDVETQVLAQDLPHGWDDTHLMGVSCAVIYEYQTGLFLVYGPNRISDLKGRILAANKVTTFNGQTFDFPVIWEVGRQAFEVTMSAGLWLDNGPDERTTSIAHSNDILQRIWRALGDESKKGWGLDAVTKATLGRGKTGELGALAPQLFKEGRWDELVSYCIGDVMITRDLSDFIDKHGYVIGPTGRSLRL